AVTSAWGSGFGRFGGAGSRPKSWSSLATSSSKAKATPKRRASPSRRISGTISSHAAPALPQLVAIDDRARRARHIVEDAALDKRVFARVADTHSLGKSWR